MSFDPLKDKYLGVPSDQQWKAAMDRLHRTEEGMVRFVGDLMGYGRTMQLCEQIWREKDPSGSGHTVGPCSMFIVPCPHTGYENGVACEWCCGSGRVTKRVLQAMGSDATARVIDDTAQQNCADPARDDLTVPLAVELAETKTEVLRLRAELKEAEDAANQAQRDIDGALNERNHARHDAAEAEQRMREKCARYIQNGAGIRFLVDEDTRNLLADGLRAVPTSTGD